MITSKHFTLIALMAATIATTSNTYAMQPDERPKRQRDERGEGRRTDRPRTEALVNPFERQTNETLQLIWQQLQRNTVNPTAFQSAHDAFKKLAHLRLVDCRFNQTLQQIIPTSAEMAGLARPTDPAYCLGSDDDVVAVSAALGKLDGISLAHTPRLHFGPNASAAHYAAYFNQPNTLAYLIAINPAYLTVMDGDNKTPLHITLEQGHFNCALILATQMLDRLQREHCNAYHPNPATTKAAQQTKINALQKEIDCYQQLYTAVSQNNSALALELLLSSEIPENTKDNKGMTALIRAAKTNNLPEVQRLLAIPGINVNAQDNYDHIALRRAASKGNLTMVQALLAAGANANAQDTYGWTALHWAAVDNHLTMVQALLAAGANVNNRGIYGETALYGAAGHGHLAIVQALLAAPGMTRKTVDNTLVDDTLTWVTLNSEITRPLQDWLANDPQK